VNFCVGLDLVPPGVVPVPCWEQGRPRLRPDWAVADKTAVGPCIDIEGVSWDKRLFRHHV
jgi:hypothetical protein